MKRPTPFNHAMLGSKMAHISKLQSIQVFLEQRECTLCPSSKYNDGANMQIMSSDFIESLDKKQDHLPGIENPHIGVGMDPNIPI